jgi:hypothetical protein
MRNLKAMGLFVIVFAAMGVSSASAVEFHAESAPALVRGSATEGMKLTTTAGSAGCTAESYLGKMELSNQSTLAMGAEYSGCTAFGFGATWAMNECEYVLHAGGGTVDIACPAGHEITITATSFGTTKCIVHVPPQTGLGAITYDNEGTGSTRDFKVTFNVTGIRYTHTAGTGIGACTPGGSGTTGTLQGTVTTTGSTLNGAFHIGIWVA